MAKDLSLKGLLTVDELMNAEKEIIRFCQRMRFPKECSNLQSGKNVKTSSNSLLCWRMVFSGLLDV